MVVFLVVLVILFLLSFGASSAGDSLLLVGPILAAGFLFLGFILDSHLEKISASIDRLRKASEKDSVRQELREFKEGKSGRRADQDTGA